MRYIAKTKGLKFSLRQFTYALYQIIKYVNLDYCQED